MTVFDAYPPTLYRPPRTKNMRVLAPAGTIYYILVKAANGSAFHGLNEGLRKVQDGMPAPHDLGTRMLAEGTGGDVQHTAAEELRLANIVNGACRRQNLHFSGLEDRYMVLVGRWAEKDLLSPASLRQESKIFVKHLKSAKTPIMFSEFGSKVCKTSWLH